MVALYKYVSGPGVLPFLLKGVVKFTPIGELNDPSELVPHVIATQVVSSRDRLRSSGYKASDLPHLLRQEKVFQRLAPRFQAIPAPRSVEAATATIRRSFYDDVPRLTGLLSETAREISRNVGLFCLSRRYDSLPMWAHYAANGSGFVVEFRDLESVFRGDDTGVLCRPVVVRYERERSGVTFDPQSHESLFFVKFQDWSYEQEVRVVLPLDDCRQELVDGKTLYLSDIPTTCVAGVILGWNMPPTGVEAIQACVRASGLAVHMKQARFERDGVRLVDL